MTAEVPRWEQVQLWGACGLRGWATNHEPQRPMVVSKRSPSSSLPRVLSSAARLIYFYLDKSRQAFFKTVYSKHNNLVTAIYSSNFIIFLVLASYFLIIFLCHLTICQTNYTSAASHSYLQLQNYKKTFTIPIVGNSFFRLKWYRCQLKFCYCFTVLHRLLLHCGSTLWLTVHAAGGATPGQIHLSLREQ